MTTVFAPLNQTVPPYVFRGGGSNNKDNIKNVPPNSISIVRSPDNATMKIVSEGGLEMIHEESIEYPNNSDGVYSCSRAKNGYFTGLGNENNSPVQEATSLSPSPSILRRSRSLPQDEFRIIGTKIYELQRNDSIVSGKSGR